MNNAKKFQDARVSTYRQSEHPINSCFTARWSPRAYDNSALPMPDLMTILEAARWAPSAYNVQPWRFLFSVRNDAYWQHYLSLLNPFNAEWAQRSGALIFLISDTLVSSFIPPKPFPTHSFDAGAAWIHIALQAQMLGYQAHAMAGIHHDKIKAELKIPARFKIEIGIAIGRVASPDVLPQDLQAREKPSTRLPLTELVHCGRYKSAKKENENEH